MIINEEYLWDNIDNKEEEFEKERKEFIIKDAGLADWAINKIKEEQQRFNIFKEVAKSKIEKLNMQIKDEERKSEGRNSFLTYKLSDWMDTVPVKKTKTQESFTLPSGKIVKKLSKAEYVSRDSDKINESDKLIEYIQQSETDIEKYIQSAIFVNWKELKKDLNINLIDNKYIITRISTGEVIEALKVEDTQEVIKVE